MVKIKIFTRQVLHMGRFDVTGRIGLRDKETDQLIAVYSGSLEGTDEEIEKRVKFWYYQQSCSAGERLQSYYVDNLSEKEIKALQ